MKNPIQKYLPEYIHLYFVDYNDNLKNQMNLLQACLEKNDLLPLNDTVWDFWDDPESYYLDEIRNAMENDGVGHLYEKHYDEILDYLNTHDSSDPVKDLLRNTGEFSCYYDLGLELDCGWNHAFMSTPWRNESPASSAYKVRRKLGMKKDSPAAQQILSLCQNASAGGSLRIYFNSSLEDLIFGDPYAETKCKGDFQQINFKGKCAVAIYNPTEGAGDVEYIDLDCSFPFVRENLSISNTDKYSLEDCFGMCGDWLDRLSKPQLLADKKTKRTIQKSKAAELRKHEAELDAVFKAGGCTAGDMDISRHRNVYYDNHFPCGSRCPHCGTFWID